MNASRLPSDMPGMKLFSSPNELWAPLERRTGRKGMQAMQQNRINWYGIGWYLGITFALTWVVMGALIALGVRFDGQPVIYAQLVVAAVMWAPALGALIVRKWITREGFSDAGLRLGSWKPYLATFVGVPAIVAAIYLVTDALGLATSDWQMGGMRDLMLSMGTPEGEIPANLTLIIFLVSVFVAPWINSVFAFGEEFGWTGYLMPRLLPLGKWKATLVYGVIWGLWHAPLILVGFNYPGQPIAGLFFMCLVTIALGLFQVALWLRNGSVIQTAFFHGVINAQAYGIWRTVYADTHPLLGGIAGLVGFVLLGAAGGYLLARSPEPRPVR